MPNLTIINLNPGDTQEVLVNKINQNFGSVVANGGGPQGQEGSQGDQGPIGQVGPKGDQGVSGTRGTRWFISVTEPLGGTAGVGIIYGDYWVATAADNEVYTYATGGWTTTGDFLQALDVFTTLNGIIGPGSVTTKNAIVQSSATPGSNTFVFSDDTSSPTSANPTYSKFLISTNAANGFPILEFGKSNATNIGTPADYNRHPFFQWKNPSGSDYGLRFVVPGDLLDIVAGGNLNIQSTNGNVNFSGVTTALSATTSITLTSVGTFNINSGSSNLLITSNQFSLGANSAFFNVPVTVSGAFGGNSMYSFSNTSTGGGLYVNLIGTTSTSRFLANFLVSGTSKFYVRSDGKVKFDKTNFAYSTYTATTPTYAISTKNYYIIGSNVLTNGNRVVVNLTAGVLGIGIAIPLNSGSTGLSDYIAVGESISMSIFSSSSTSAGWISGISYSTNGTSTAGDANFTATPVVNVTVLKTGTSSFLIYYDTTSVSGIFTV
jgi:hypothetical protein